MIRTLLLAACACSALSAAESPTGSKHRSIGTLVARQVVDAGHILEIRALPQQGNGADAYLIRWGDLDDTIPAKSGPRFDWTGAATVAGGHISAVRTVLFESGGANAKAPGQAKKHPRADHLTGDGYAGSVTWEAHTTCHWDGVVVHARGGTLAVQAGPAALSVALR